ncbi:MAG: hypothetical protein JWM89_3432 [Acidimicrobiales bacterium]|nr:hypothetical protein [Acidimicrobiales bacterium]
MSYPDPVFEPLSVAVRAWAVEATADPTAEGGIPRWRPDQKHRRTPQRTLVFDCEATTDATQRLLYGAWRLYVDRRTTPGTVCVEEGIFYADDLPDSDPAGYATIEAYTAKAKADTAPGKPTKLKLLSRAEFVELLLWKWGYKHEAVIVGYNLPFDLSRIATGAVAARKARGGISLRLWEHDGAENKYRPRVVLNNIDGHRTLIHFTQPRDAPQHYRGKFLDLRTLAFAHTDEPGLTLESASTRFGDPYDKRDVEHGTIVADNLTYCREDVAATAALLRSTHVEHHRHPIDLPPERTFSAATIGKQYWRKMGITPTIERLPDYPAEVMGWGMEAFYGARSECRIRRLAVPVVYCDFRSMYMTCHALMGSWPIICADHVALEDVTAQVRALAQPPDLAEQCFTRDLWSQLHTLVQVNPNGAILPVRGRYDEAADSHGIGVNPYQSTRPSWYCLADVLAAVLLGGPTPEIIAAWRLNPERHAAGLTPTQLCGQIPIDPTTEDFFTAAVEHRYRSAADPTLPNGERQRLSGFLKVLANASGYGTLAQFDRRREPNPVTVEVHAGHGTPFTTTTANPETPGDFCFPPLAAATTGAARLMLALLEHAVTEAGGTYAMCDTDSMAIVATARGGTIACPGGNATTRNGTPAVRALTWKQVRAITERFAALNPYNPATVPGSILRIEDENYRDGTRRQQRIDCYAISAKRYQLTGPNGIIKRSEHGLGHLMNPAPGSAWIDHAWEHLHNPTGAGPGWLDLPAVSRITVSSAEALGWFANMNRGLPYADQIKPGNFLLIAHPDPLDPSSAQPIAPYDPDPANWTDLDWTDRRTGQPVRIRTKQADGTLRPGTVHVHTYRHLLARYHAHPEAKALAPDGGPVRPETTGLLRRRPVQAIQPVTYIGKEANDLEQRATGTSTDDHTTTYENRTSEDWDSLVVPVLRTIPTRTTARATGIGQRTIQRALSGRTRPHPDARRTLTDHAIEHARNQLGPVPRIPSHRTALHRYLQTVKPMP